MTLLTEIQNDADEILTDEGVSITVYLNPSYSLDNEGEDTITKGTGTSADALIRTSRGDVITPEMEGFDKSLEYIVQVSQSVGTVEENDIVEIDSEYYRITSINSNLLGAGNAFYELKVERIQPQSKVS